MPKPLQHAAALTRYKCLDLSAASPQQHARTRAAMRGACGGSRAGSSWGWQPPGPPAGELRRPAPLARSRRPPGSASATPTPCSSPSSCGSPARRHACVMGFWSGRVGCRVRVRVKSRFGSWAMHTPCIHGQRHQVCLGLSEPEYRILARNGLLLYLLRKCQRARAGLPRGDHRAEVRQHLALLWRVGHRDHRHAALRLAGP